MQVKNFKIRLNKEFTEQDEKIMNDFMEGVTVTKSYIQMITNEDENYWSALVFFEYLSSNPKASTYYSAMVKDYSQLNDVQKKQYDAIVEWRNKIAEQSAIHPSNVLKKDEVFAIVKWSHRSVNALLSIDGFGEIRKEKYGEKIIEIMNSISG